MGYAPGEGLGKRKQGITEPIEARSKIGRLGLGLETERQHKVKIITFDFRILKGFKVII